MNGKDVDEKAYTWKHNKLERHELTNFEKYSQTYILRT